MNTPLDHWRRRSRDAYFPGSTVRRVDRFPLALSYIALAMIIGAVLYTCFS